MIATLWTAASLVVLALVALLRFFDLFPGWSQ